MNQLEFWTEMQALLEKYDLLRHPFYQDWTAGKLTIDELREYAAEYYHHVSSFPNYLRELAARVADGDLRQSILRNLWDELGMHSPEAGPHHLLWLDFAVGADALPPDVVRRKPLPKTISLIETFFTIAKSATPVEALAAFYVYESQVPECPARRQSR